MNITGILYADIASSRIATITSAMDTVLAAETTVLYPILKALAILFIGRQFFLVMLGYMTTDRFFASIIRVGIVTLLVTHSGQYVQRIRNPVFNTIPQAISHFVANGYSATSANQPLAKQFDAVSAGADAVTAQITEKTSVSSPQTWVDSMTAEFADFCMQAILAVIVGIWLLGQSFLAIILCFGPLVLCFELFDRTRGFVDQWIGKMVGMTAFGFATSIVLATQAQGLITLLHNADAAIGTNPAMAVSTLFRIVGDTVLDLLVMAGLPSVVGFGSGALAGLAAPSAFAAGRALSMASGGAAGLANKAIARTARLAAPASRNALARS